MSIEIVFLGTSAGLPTEERNVSSVIVRRESEILMFDIGEGTQKQLIKANIGIKQKLTIFISHLHGDHIFGLLGLIQSYNLIGRKTALEIFGPKDLKKFVYENMKLLNINLTYPLIIRNSKQGIITEGKDYTIKAIESDHRIESYSYCIEEKLRPGKFNPEKANKLKIPIKFWKTLKSGFPVTINKKNIDASLIVSPPRRGRKIVYSGDTRPTEKMITFAKNADILIHESTYDEKMRARADKHFHSTARQAAEIAKKANVQLLVLTHMSPRYKDPSILYKEAYEIFKNVMIAEDLLKINVNLSKD